MTHSVLNRLYCSSAF